MQNATKQAGIVTPVTPSKKGCHGCRASIHAACATVTPVTPYMQARTHTRTRTPACNQVSHMSQVEHSIRIMSL